MTHTITGIVDKPVAAQRIIEELTTTCLSDRSDISVVAKEGTVHVPGAMAQSAKAAGQVAGAASEAAAAAGSVLAGFASAVTRHVPGFGVLSAFGHLGAKLSSAALGSTQELAKAFVDLGVRQGLANQYADALREGRILIVVDAKTENMARCARQVMATHGAVTPETV
jgi:hypothetical protein